VIFKDLYKLQKYAKLSRNSNYKIIIFILRYLKEKPMGIVYISHVLHIFFRGNELIIVRK